MASINGYLNTYLPNHERASKTNGMIYNHVLVAEQKLNRMLKKDEVVHHIDGNRSNNSEENLLVFASNRDHSSFHR